MGSPRANSGITFLGVRQDRPGTGKLLSDAGPAVGQPGELVSHPRPGMDRTPAELHG